MNALKPFWQRFTVVVLFCAFASTPCEGQFLDYFFDGVITEVTENENDAVPNLAVGDTFSGQLRFDSRGWHNTAGIISVTINGVELRFEGDSIFGGLSVDPDYSFRIAADAGGDIRNSTFQAFNFGIQFEDIGSSFPYSDTFPEFVASEDYETNVVRIWGSMVASGDRVIALGEVTFLGQVAVDCFGDNNGDANVDVDDINAFADVLNESALFNRCFDVVEDGMITLEDHDALIEFAVELANGQRGTSIGDINLDGVVDILNDGFTLVGNLGLPGPFGYQDGDLNADRQVDVLGDGFRFLANFGQ